MIPNTKNRVLYFEPQTIIYPKKILEKFQKVYRIFN